jgi:hypothetical protein
VQGETNLALASLPLLADPLNVKLRAPLLPTTTGRSQRLSGGFCSTTGSANCQACCEKKNADKTVKDDPSCPCALTEDKAQELASSTCASTGAANCRACCDRKAKVKIKDFTCSDACPKNDIQTQT